MCSLLLTTISLPDTAQNWNQIINAAASGPATGDQFGHSVSISGNYAIVGAFRKNDNTAYVFIRSGENWVQQAKLTASDGASGEYFGTSVSISGDYAIVGAPDKNTNTGAAYVFGNCTTGITGQPVASSAVCACTTVTAYVSTTGTFGSYQWYKGTTPVASQTAATLSIPSTITADAGICSVVVTGGVCSYTSTIFTLTVNQQPTATILTPASTALTCSTPSISLTATGGDVSLG
ncbi:FG-GAP repeat protein [Spirosoma profusum]|uniref:FG-GAP repeat protein n=1 Tax=Spirosoma profusum TaxID=2771354 RepID=UPI00293B8F8E|nr:FG-GAP repeat protein [Spirosoma profusum]